ncbi:MAG: condensation domain-containing protein [Planctomycetota bacterium]|jgi:acyl carrier protein
MDKKIVEAIYPLSPQQQGMLFEALFAAQNGIFVEQEIHTWRTLIDSKVFRQAWQRIVGRHPVLRTAFVWKEQDDPLQVVLRHVKIPFEEEDWRGLQPSEQQNRLTKYVTRVRQEGIDLKRPPLMRFALFRLQEMVYQFVWSQHHIVMDGWCRPILFKEFEALYLAFSRGEEPVLATPPPYRDYIAWLKQQDLSAAADFWRKSLQGISHPTAIGKIVKPASAFGATQGYGTLERDLEQQVTRTLESQVRQHRLTFNTLLQGVWALLLSRYSGEQEVVFGTTVSGRPASLQGSGGMIGLFMNTLPFRVKVEPASGLWEWLNVLQVQHAECREYQYCSTGQIHEWSPLPGSQPLYESLIVVENYPTDALGETQRTAMPGTQSIGAQTSYALTILFWIGPELRLQYVCDTRRLRQDDLPCIAGHFQMLLKSIAAEPDQNLVQLLEKIPRDEIPLFQPLSLIQARREEKEHVAPRTSTEALLAGIWRELLEIDQIGIDDNFFDLGGHSLLGMQLVSRIRETFEIEFPLGRLFEGPTIENLALVVEEILIAEIEALSDEEAKRLVKLEG